MGKKNLKTLKREIEEELRRWESLPCSLISRINTATWPSYQRQSTDSMQFPSEFQQILHRPWKDNSQLHMEKQKNHDS